MAPSLLGKRKSRSKNLGEFLLDPEYDRSNAPIKSRGKQLLRSIASVFGFGRKKKGEEPERIGYEKIEGIGYEKLEKNELEMPFQWTGFEEKSGDLMENTEEGKRKRPRLEDLLGWNLKLSEKDEI